ncbi:hypothetical protein HYDPIDRAFT_30376 [Hydnomerulius pinastri MD-312]|uniref:Transmembrane protein n=1 Tax=Hydnomerulius pinastri MD-312 TaxID=994086 RepID=A0A0C9VW55_9AGAM|nr:hypothetical protein HYDPIDRAFT_30376 [Hydnomerulius pinastri MD-312]
MVYIKESGSSSTSLSATPVTSTSEILNHYNINYLQAIPLVASLTTYDFWWPYPAPGISTLTSPSTTSASVADMAITSDVQNVAAPTDGPATSVIQITALPPATTLPPQVSAKLPYHHQLNVIYLVPLFAVLGLILGILAATTWLKRRENQRGMRRSSTFEPGPPYVPAENDTEEDNLHVHETQSMEQVSLFAAGTPSKVTIHGARYTSKRSLLWPSLGRAQQPLSHQSGYAQTIIPSLDGERFTVVQEDPFIATPKPSARSTSKVSLPRITVSPSLSLLSSEDQHDQHSQSGGDIQRPIRRSMFDRLKFGNPHRSASSERGGYVAVDIVHDPSDTTPTNNIRRAASLKKDECSPLSAGRSSGIPTNRRSPKGELQTAKSKDLPKDTDAQDDMDGLIHAKEYVPADERRFFVERGESFSSGQDGATYKRRDVTPYALEHQGSPSWGKEENEGLKEGRTGRQATEEHHPDNYTKAPHRRHSRHKGQRMLSKGPSRGPSVPHIHSSVLPRSPPALMSPPLESTLFFTSPLSLSMSGRVPAKASGVVSPKLRAFDSTPELSLFPLPSKKSTKKLQTSRPAPLLPYPSYPDSPLPRRMKPKLRDRSMSGGQKGLITPLGSPRPKGRSTSATSRDTANGMWSLGSLSPTTLAIALASSESSDALSRVNEIVAQGYNEKQTLSGEDIVASNN